MDAILAEVEPYTIHGTRFYRIVYATAEQPDRMTEGRVAAEGMYKSPQAGDKVDIRVLLGVIDQVKRRE
ncbi:MAG: hypothetical protein ABI577_10105 [bacterium]